MDTNPPRFLPPELPDLAPPTASPASGPTPPRPARSAAPPASATRPTPASRRSSRLRTITAGVAVLGVAATAGLGLVAARTTPAPSTSDAGTPAATAAPEIVTGQPGFDDDAGVPSFTDPRTPSGRRWLPPGIGAPAPGGTTIEPPAGATGPGDVSTGGS